MVLLANYLGNDGVRNQDTTTFVFPFMLGNLVKHNNPVTVSEYLPGTLFVALIEGKPEVFFDEKEIETIANSKDMDVGYFPVTFYQENPSVMKTMLTGLVNFNECVSALSGENHVPPKSIDDVYHNMAKNAVHLQMQVLKYEDTVRGRISKAIEETGYITGFKLEITNYYEKLFQKLGEDPISKELIESNVEKILQQIPVIHGTSRISIVPDAGADLFLLLYETITGKGYDFHVDGKSVTEIEMSPKTVHIGPMFDYCD